MTYFSDNEELEIGENYTRGMLADYMNIRYQNDEIERIIYQPRQYSTIFIFSTINNNLGYIYGKLSDNTFIFNRVDDAIINHRVTHKEILLFIREDDRTGFYYFGRCKFSHEIKKSSTDWPDYFCLELLDTKFSRVKGVEVPELKIE